MPTVDPDPIIIVDPDPDPDPIEELYSTAVKLNNTIVENCTIQCTDTYRILATEHSSIKESELTINFVDKTAENIDRPIINLESTDMNINLITSTDINENIEPLIYASGHSKVFVEYITFDYDYPPYGSPEFTPYDAEYPTYGNFMSYIIAELNEQPSSSSSSGSGG